MVHATSATNGAKQEANAATHETDIAVAVAEVRTIKDCRYQLVSGCERARLVVIAHRSVHSRSAATNKLQSGSPLCVKLNRVI